MVNAAKSLMEFRVLNFNRQPQRRHKFSLIDFNQNNFPLIARNIRENMEKDKTILEIGEDIRTENIDHMLVNLIRIANPSMCGQPGWKRQPLTGNSLSILKKQTESSGVFEHLPK
jgi:hypothetical protein